MKRFADLLDALVFMPSRNGKISLMADYFANAPDPDRGYALAALCGALEMKAIRPAQIHALVAERVDPELFRWSYDFVGDLAETTALIWPAPEGGEEWPHLADVVQTLARAGRLDAPAHLARWLDDLDATGRWALLKLLTGGLRVGVSARLAKTAVSEWSGLDLGEIEEVWHALDPPYRELFQWADGRTGRPSVADRPVFRPLMLAHPIEISEAAAIDPRVHRAEWKWDGIRVQMVARGTERRLYSRTGDDISAAFPDIVERMEFQGVLDGELLVAREGEIAPFNDLQQRLNRKTVSRKMLTEFPAHVRLYDILFDGRDDLRGHEFDRRRIRLERFVERHDPERLDLSPLIKFDDANALAAMRAEPPHPAIEGVMVKRADSLYVAGRPKGLWWKWKRDPKAIDAVVMYAQRGHGKRSSYFSDYTFGLWRETTAGTELVPVGKAYFGFTDEELRRLDKWVRDHTVDRYGPVRAVSHDLVVEVAFDAVQRSRRHKSGVAMRFPRFRRIRWDKPAAEADVLTTLEAMIET